MPLVPLSGLGSSTDGLPHRTPQTTDLLTVSVPGSSTGYKAAVSEVLGAAIPSIVNEWIDPQFCLQDQNGMMSAINDAGTGTVAALTVTAFTTGSLTIVCSCANTSAIYLGECLGTFAGGGLDTVLSTAGRTFRVTAIVPNVSFTVISEQYWGAPTVSSACTFQPVMRGVSAGSVGNITSNVQFFTSGGAANIWISDRPAHIARFKGCSRVIVFQVTGTSGSIVFQPNKPLSYCYNQNRAVGMAAIVLSGTGNAQAYINNGAVQFGGALATTNARTWIGQQINCGGATTYSVACFMSGAGYYMIGEFTEASSASILSDGTFSTPLWSCAKAIASVSPWVGINVTFPSTAGIPVDMLQVSQGVMRRGISYFWGLLEGQNITAVGQFFASLVTPSGTIYNPVMECLNTSFYSFVPGNFHLDSNARMTIYGNSGGAWQHISWDISMVFIGTPN